MTLGWMLDGFRTCLAALGASFWVEYACGNSLVAYHALDLYIRITSSHVVNRGYAAWWLLNASQPTRYREVPSVYQWSEMKDYFSYGQRYAAFDDFEVQSQMQRLIQYRNEQSLLYVQEHLPRDDFMRMFLETMSLHAWPRCLEYSTFHQSLGFSVLLKSHYSISNAPKVQRISYRR